MELQVFLLFMGDIPSYIFFFSLSIHLLMDISVVSISWLLEIMLQ